MHNATSSMLIRSLTAIISISIHVMMIWLRPKEENRKAKLEKFFIDVPAVVVATSEMKYITVFF